MTDETCAGAELNPEACPEERAGNAVHHAGGEAARSGTIVHPRRGTKKGKGDRFAIVPAECKKNQGTYLWQPTSGTETVIERAEAIRVDRAVEVNSPVEAAAEARAAKRAMAIRAPCNAERSAVRAAVAIDLRSPQNSLKGKPFLRQGSCPLPR